MSKRFFIGAVAALFAPLAAAQQPPYPSKSIRMIASQAPGGGIDTLCRIVAPKLSEAFGQTVIVENRAGANGSLAAEVTAKSPPDGYTIMLGAVGNLGTNVIYYKKLEYDPVRDLAPITPAILSASVLVVHPSVPARSVKELIMLARKQPNALAYGTSGTGGAGHLAGALFRSMTKTQLLHVPYKGGAPAAAATVAGETAAVWSGSSNAAQIKAGRLRPIAVSGAHRSAQYPDLPTIGEFYPGFENSIWLGLFGPAGMPEETLAKLRAEMRRVLESPDVKQKMNAAGGLDPYLASPEEFAALIQRDYEKYAKVVKDIGLKVD